MISDILVCPAVDIDDVELQYGITIVGIDQPGVVAREIAFLGHREGSRLFHGDTIDTVTDRTHQLLVALVQIIGTCRRQLVATDIDCIVDTCLILLGTFLFTSYTHHDF